jgi:hypothetical protein
LKENADAVIGKFFLFTLRYRQRVKKEGKLAECIIDS